MNYSFACGNSFFSIYLPNDLQLDLNFPQVENMKNSSVNCNFNKIGISITIAEQVITASTTTKVIQIPF